MLCKIHATAGSWRRRGAFGSAQTAARVSQPANWSHQWHRPSATKRATLSQLVGMTGVSALLLQRLAGAAAAGTSVEQVLKNPKWPQSWPFRAEQFQRFDESPDAVFYDSPRYVTHIDDPAIGALTQYYSKVFPKSGQKDIAMLDLCSSWVSHYPKGFTAGRIAGLGMNEAELARNPVLTEWAVKDLNRDPTLPYKDDSFDVITNVVSVDYLTRPLEVFREMHRVLKPGGNAIMSFSNRCFPTKAISIWTQTGDEDHAWIIGAYFHYSVEGGYTEPVSEDISPKANFLFGKTDPMYIVSACKKA